MTTGALMLDLDGLELMPEERQLLAHPEVGGLILFARNYESPDQLKNLMGQIREVRPDLLVAIDQEGGRVQRIRTGATRLPPMAFLGALWRVEPEQAVAESRELGWLMAAELRAFDIDFSFAPVLDLDWSRSGVIGDRAFADTAEAVGILATAFMQGMHEAGMAATGKHFPGHGWVRADSHLEIPVDERTLEQIEADDLRPFARLIDAGLDAIMPAHVIYSSVSPDPAGFSEYWLRDCLRRRLDFDGVIFSDDLNMEGARAAGGFAESAERALLAGCDMVLACNNRAGALDVLEYLKSVGLPSSRQPSIQPSTRLERMRARGGIKFDDARLCDARAIADRLREERGQ